MIDRKPLRPNQQRGLIQHFPYNQNLGYKSKADPSVVGWASTGKGIEGESVNSKNNAARLIFRKNWKPL